jgi:hypothetical protein
MLSMRKDRLSEGRMGSIMPAVKPEMPTEKSVLNAYGKFMQQGGNMTIRTIRNSKPARVAANVLARPREMFGESLPELLLVTAVVAAVVSAVLALNGAS